MWAPPFRDYPPQKSFSSGAGPPVADMASIRRAESHGVVRPLPVSHGGAVAVVRGDMIPPKPEEGRPEIGASSPSIARGVDVGIVAFGQIFQQMLTVGTGIVIGRMLGPAGYGVVNLLRTIFGAIQTLTPLGLDLALLKYSGQNAEHPSQVRAMVSRLRLIVFAVNLLLAASLGFGLGGYLGAHIYHVEGFETYWLITLIGMPMASDMALLSAYYKGLNRPGAFALMTLYLQPIARVVLIGVALYTSLTVFSVLCINSAQLAISLFVVNIDMDLYFRRKKIGNAQPPNVRAVRRILRVSIWMALSLFIYGMMRFVDVTMLGALGTAKDVGEYGALSTIAQLVQVYPLAISQTLGPNVANRFHAGDIVGVKNALGRYIYTASVIASFMFAGIAVFGDRLDLIFGKSFHFGAGIAFLLPLGYLLSATLAPTGFALSMTGRHRGETFILSAGALLLVALCWILIPIAGQNGAALATATSFLFINVVRFAYVARVLNFVPGRPADILPPFVAVICAFGAKYAIGFVLEKDLIGTFVACVLFTLLYGATAMVVFVRPEDRASIFGRAAAFMEPRK